MAQTTTRRRSGSSTQADIPGTIYQWELPEWQPLMELVGDLSSWFMWMGELRLKDGTRLHAYKHRETRRYIHVSADGRTYRYVPPPHLGTEDEGAYRPISRVAALDEAFLDWGSFHEASDTWTEDQATLERMRALAGSGELAPFSHEFLARQRRFEAACAAARLHERTNDPGFSVLRFGDDGNRYFGDLESLDDSTVALEQRAG